MHFIAENTYAIMRVGIAGFFDYVERTFAHPSNTATYITYSQGTQSSLENVFTQSRMTNRDSAATFGKGMMAQAFKKSDKAVARQTAKGRAYPSGQLTGDEKETALLGDIFGRREEERENTLKEWQQHLHGGDDVSMCQFPEHMGTLALNVWEQNAMQVIEMNPNVSVDHFSVVLLGDADSSFREMAKIATLGPLADWFASLFKLNADEVLMFDVLCQLLNIEILKQFGEMMADREKSKKAKSTATYNQRVCEYLQSDDFGSLVNDIAIESLRNRVGVAILVEELSRRFLSNLSGGMHERSRLCQRGQGIRPDRRDVNRFLGWAIAGLIKNVRESMRKDAHSEETEETVEESPMMLELGNDGSCPRTLEDITSEIQETQRTRAKQSDAKALLKEATLELLQSMRIFHEEAVLDDAYMRDCYDLAYQAKNHGYLTLVTPKYFGFSVLLLNACVNAVNQNTLTTKGNAAWESGRRSVLGNATLCEKFLECASDSALPDNEKRRLFKKLAIKVLNACFGVEERVYNERNTGRCFKNRNEGTHRGRLKAQTQGTENKLDMEKVKIEKLG